MSANITNQTDIAGPVISFHYGAKGHGKLKNLYLMMIRDALKATVNKKSSELKKPATASKPATSKKATKKKASSK